jgi:hypothetical protein
MKNSPFQYNDSLFPEYRVYNIKLKFTTILFPYWYCKDSGPFD